MDSEINQAIQRINELIAPPARSAAMTEWEDVAEHDPDVVIAARAIAENGVGRPWDDFEPVNAYDIDQSDLIEYGRAAVAALRAAHPTTSPEPDAVREALLRIAFDNDVNGLVADPSKWPSTIAYFALGGRVADGQRIDDRASLSRPAHGGWEDISTAPQDGSHFTAYEEDRGAFECWWHDDWPHAEHYWMDHADSEPNPTHWRPLITPPISRNDR